VKYGAALAAAPRPPAARYDRRMPRPIRRTLSLLALVALAPAPAAAWGPAGHQIVAAIAEARLSPEARRLVRELVADEPLAAPDIASWADGLRDPHKRPWHYVNIPPGAAYDPRRDCARGCAVETIRWAARELEGRGPAFRRADALRWLVHVVGDIHQPLHAWDAMDRGGNDLPVRIGRRRQPIPFHRIWDVEVVKPLARRDDPLAAAALGLAVRPDLAAAWGADLDPAAWANESHREAEAIFAELGRRPGDRSLLVLPADYSAREAPRAARALQRAGVRLAALLDRVARARATGDSH